MTEEHQFYSIRSGSNPNAEGFGIDDFRELFARVYRNFRSEGYFDQSFGFWCVDAEDIPGTIQDPELEIFLKMRKKNIWPIDNYCEFYTEDDLLDVIEFLHLHVSKPIDGTFHDWNECGMHWETFSKNEGQAEFREKINDLLKLYKEPFELAKTGMVLRRAEQGFEKIFEADIPSDNQNIKSRIDAAVQSFRRHGSTIDDRRQAVRDLADVLEYLKPKVQDFLTNKDEKDLFNIANNFGIRHHNDKQKTGYDAAIWLSWMFYFYLATIHVLLRRIEHET